MNFWKRYDWDQVDKRRMGKWGVGYVAILLALFGLEMAGVGNPAMGDTLTEFSTWLGYGSKPIAAAGLAFVTWLALHFWRRLGPALFARREDES